MSILKFDEKDLITWSNRHTVKVGDNGYFANNITDLNKKIETGRVYELMSISDNYNWCFTDGTFRYGFFLPVDAVKEEKEYRPCKNIEELYFVVFNHFPRASMKIGNIARNLVDNVHHIRNKRSGNEYYTYIGSFSLEELFEEFEIEINGKWLPFGIEETTTEE